MNFLIIHPLKTPENQNKIITLKIFSQAVAIVTLLVGEKDISRFYVSVSSILVDFGKISFRDNF